MSAPQKDGPTGEGEAKALAKLPNHCSESLDEQLVFTGLDLETLSEAGAQKCGEGGK
jgi:hypothetical protein